MTYGLEKRGKVWHWHVKSSPDTIAFGWARFKWIARHDMKTELRRIARA